MIYAIFIKRLRRVAVLSIRLNNIFFSIFTGIEKAIINNM